MVLLGVFLPDIVARGAMAVFPEYTMQAQFFHTPVACFFQTILISCLFIRRQRFQVFKAITLGWILHQSFDLIQTTLGYGFYFPLWPLYGQAIKFPLLEATDWPGIAAVTALMALASEFLLKKMRKNEKAFPSRGPLS